MGLNISKGNMYPFVTHTFNVIKGKCQHDCIYCYMKQFPQRELHFDKSELNTDLGKDNFIFVGSSTDMWADNVPEKWIKDVLKYCAEFSNKYLFQTKNPGRYLSVEKFNFPANTIFGTTIETNRNRYLDISNAPPIKDRIRVMNALNFINLKTMITIEPVMDFDLEPFADMLIGARPDWINIGADSKGHNLPEPSRENINKLIKELEKFTTIKIKKNLARIK